MQLQMDRLIDAPRERVFDFFADCRNELQWNDTVKTMDKLTPGPVGLGTRFRGDYAQVGETTFEIVEYERPSRIRFRGAFQTLVFDMAATLRESENGWTRFIFATDFQPRGIMRLLMPLIGGKMARDYQARGAALQRALEQGSTTGASTES